MTTRQEKVNSLLQKKISEYFSRERPEELTGLVTIKHVAVTADMHEAAVYFSVVGQIPDEVQKILERKKFFLQKILGRSLSMKFTPRLQFVYDGSEEYVQRINRLIKKANLK